MPQEPWRVLVANRGEIAWRVLRGLRSLGLEGVAVYSDADADAPYLRAAHRAVAIGGSTPAESYLDIDKIIAAARASGTTAIHPGYGFLSENAVFAERVESEGLVFIGPTAESIRLMGDKMAALEVARDSGVPTIPSFAPKSRDGSSDGNVAIETLRERATAIGLPILIKASAGGGGKGMRIVRELDGLDEALASAVREAQSAFGDGRVFLERYLEHARHVEIQVLGDGEGAGVALGERDCSVQRRHQKLVEECPAPNLPAETRDAMASAAVGLVEKTRYRGVGTVEFIYDATAAAGGGFYFLEMNTRLQVEHPVTELVHGVDLVAAQLQIAQGLGIAKELRETRARGHAIEVRVYAEDPANGFLPSIGSIDGLVWPSGPGIRLDSGIELGSAVTINYDPMLAKLIVHAPDRRTAIDQLCAALGETFIAGVETTIPFCRDVLASDAFRSGDVFTTIIAERFTPWNVPKTSDAFHRAAALLAPRLVARSNDRGGEAGEPALWQTLGAWRIAE